MTDFGFGRTQRQQRYNNFNRQVNGPEQMNGSRAVQAEITVNVPFSQNFAESRKGGEMDGMRRFGLVTDPSRLNIYEGQLLVRQTRSRVGNNRNRSRGDPVFNAFSSFVGLPIYADDEQDPVRWKATWMFAGIAKSNIEMNEPIGTNEVAAAMGGAMTIQTNGVLPILPGNYLKFVVPSPTGDDELHKLAEDAKVAHDRYAPTVVPERPEDGLHFLSTVLLRYANAFVLNTNKAGRDQRLLATPRRAAGQTTSNTFDSAESFLVEEYIDGSVEDFAHAVDLAIRLGFVTGNLPTIPAQVQQLASSLDNSLKTSSIDGPSSPREVAGNITRLAPANQAGAAEKDARMAQVNALHTLLGLTAGVAPIAAPSAETRQVIMMHRARGLLPTTPNFRTVKAHLSVANVGSRTVGVNLSDAEKRMDTAHINRAREGYMAFHSAYAFQASNRFAMAIGGSKPAGEVDAKF